MNHGQKIIVIIIFGIIATAAIAKFLSSPPEVVSAVSPMAGGDLTFEDLLDAIEQVESGGDANAIGDNGNAVGSFQIWRIYVSDCNRISGKKFKFSDRLSREKSREMVGIYLTHYGGTIEEMARKHNGGPNGHKKQSTEKYWLKIKAELEQNNV